LNSGFFNNLNQVNNYRHLNPHLPCLQFHSHVLYRTLLFQGAFFADSCSFCSLPFQFSVRRQDLGPVSALHLNLFFIFSLVYNVYGHLGFELYPKNFNTHWFGKWMNTSIAHNMHHPYFDGNYGLYFTIWDRAMGTLRKEYDERFDEVTSR